jgi:alpha-ketoglutarate-dependent taurine dioxygenase
MVRVSEPAVRGGYALIEPDAAGQNTSDIPEGVIEEQIKTYGAVLLRGFGKLTKGSFKSLGSRLCSGFVLNEATARNLVGLDRRVQTVSKGDTFLPLHCEMERVPWQPDLCIFGALEAYESEAGDGETLLCDGTLVLEKMRPETREFLANTKLRYRVRTTKKECERWLGISNPTQEDMDLAKREDFFEYKLENGNYYSDYYIPALRKPMVSGDLTYANFILFARFFNNTRDYPSLQDGSEIPEGLCQELKSLCDGLAVTHTWQSGDVLIFDNTRFQHGRNPITNPERRKIITQFGFAKFADVSEQEIAERPWRTSPAWGQQEVQGSKIPTLPGHDVMRQMARLTKKAARRVFGAPSHRT